MKPKLLLRIASIVMILHDVGHIGGSLTWKQATDPEKQQVISQMTDHKFPFMGAMRSMGDYYDGYGFASALAILLIAAILWIVSGSVSQNPALAKKILITVSAILLAWGINELIFFFPFAASFSLLAMLLTAVAAFQLKVDIK
ncbi:MAG: hypothetical protein WBZ48_11135 [Bacteroidota bacterium]